MEEIWKDIKGYEGLYQVSNLGRVKSLERILKHKTTYGGTYTVKEKILKPKEDKGYYRYSLSNSGKNKLFFGHRLVAEAFIPNPQHYLIVNHKDENPHNNRADNLEWCTVKYNVTYGTAIERKIKKLGKKINQYDIQDNFIKQFANLTEAKEYLNVKGKTLIARCARGKCKTAYGYKWKYADE